MRAWLLLVVALSGCRSLHESQIKQRLVQSRFFAREIAKPFQDVDTLLTSRRQDAVRTWCELCVVSAETMPDGRRRYCLSSRGENACVIGSAASPTTTRFVADEPPVSSTVIRSLWLALEPEAASVADFSDSEELSYLAAEEEEAFTSRWTVLAGAKAGAVISYDPPTFTFGGQIGFRYWGSLFVLPGAALEIENMLQAGRSLVTSNLQGRIELALWNDENTRFFNLPKLSFFMAGGPLIGFGRTPALGGRASFGIHLIHLGSFVTPFFFELGFQVLEVDEQSASGLRIGLGLGI